MSEWSALKKMMVAAVLGCLVLVGGLAFVTYKSSQAAQGVLHKLSKQKEILKALKEDLTQSRQTIEQLKKEQEEFKKNLFDERDVPAFLDKISTSAANSSVVVLEMKTQQFSAVTIPKEMQDINRQVSRVKFVEKENSATMETAQLNEMLTLAAMPVRIKIKGNFESIVNFLNSIENYRQLLTVSNVEIAREEYPQLTCQFNLRIYSLKKLKDIKP